MNAGVGAFNVAGVLGSWARWLRRLNWESSAVVDVLALMRAGGGFNLYEREHGSGRDLLAERLREKFGRQGVNVKVMTISRDYWENRERDAVHLGSKEVAGICGAGCVCTNGK